MENKDNPSGIPEATGGAPEKETDKVAYSSYQKALSEKKNIKTELEKVLSELNAYKLKEEESKGNFDSVKQRLEAELNLEKQKNKKIYEDAIKTNRSLEIKKQAQKFGVIEEAVEDLLKIGEWDKVATDENDPTGLSPDVKQIENMFQDMVKTKPFFFKQANKSFHTITTTGNSSSLNINDLKGKSHEELRELLKKMN